MAFFEELYDDIPIHPALRIPPLQDPYPEVPQTARLLPLEPTARVNANVDGEAAKLTGRRKALAEAKGIGEEESTELWPMQQQKPLKKKSKLYEHERIADFVQLPKPRTKNKEAKPPPFQPVSEINELHEPPPSAALFPPITPNEKNTVETRRPSSLSPILHARVEEQVECSEKKPARKSNGAPAKRVYLRNRTMWTDEETENLARGVAMYGIGKWKKILNHPGFNFQGRTYVDLKDRFRTKYGGKISNIPEEISSLANLPPLVTRSGKEMFSGADSSKTTKITKRKGAWSEAEDSALIAGYEKHGFSWAKIAKDPALTFCSRTGPQIRDRFRQLFPTSYGEGRAMKEREGSKIKQQNLSNSKSTAFDEIITCHGTKTKGKNSNTKTGAREPASSDIDNVAVNPQTHYSICRIPFQPSASNTIMGILNQELDDNPPSSAMSSEDLDQGTTLPPLMWEDLATRPLFDFGD